MKAIRICLALLTVLGGNAFADGPAFPLRCYPPVDLTLSAYKFDEAPAGYTSKWNKAVTFTDCQTGKVIVQLWSDDERNQLKWDAWDIMLAVRNGLTLSQALTAWAASQPVHVATAEELAWKQQLEAKYAPPVQVCKITAQSATVPDRQVYRANAAKTGVGSAIAGVRVAAGTVCGARLGTTSYYSVAGQKDTQGRFIPEGWAIGVVK